MKNPSLDIPLFSQLFYCFDVILKTNTKTGNGAKKLKNEKLWGPNAPRC